MKGKHQPTVQHAERWLPTTKPNWKPRVTVGQPEIKMHDNRVHCWISGSGVQKQNDIKHKFLYSPRITVT